MAKFVLKDSIGELNYATLNLFDLATSAKSGKRLELTGPNDFQLVYSGTGFTYDGDTPTGGKVTKIEFLDDAGKPLLVVTQGNFKLEDIFTRFPNSDIDIFDTIERGNDTFIGSSVGDVILYGSNKGNDTIKGMGGNDYIQASAGKNKYDGGAGDHDILTYQNNTDGPGLKGVKVDLDAGKATNPWGQTDTIKNIEEVRGTARNDVFKGSKNDDIFDGSGGNDRFTGGKGDDEFRFETTIGKSIITDFDAKGGDDIVMLSYFADIQDYGDIKKLIKQKGDDVVMDLGGGDVLTFLDADKKDFNAKDFEFEVF